MVIGCYEVFRMIGEEGEICEEERTCWEYGEELV